MSMLKKGSQKGKTKADFKAQFDKNTIIPKKIQEGLDEMAKAGPENWETEKEFLTRTGISTLDLATFREGFEAYIVVVKDTDSRDKRVWCCSKKLAAELRGLPK